MKLDFNYTYTSPFYIPTNSEESNPANIRIGDIASHKGNAILNWRFNKRKDSEEYRFNWNSRLNISGERLTGSQTTVSSNPVAQVDSFSILNSYFSYSNKFGLTFGIGVNNILDSLWYVPGARSATAQYASIVPQAGRNYFFNLRYDLQ